MSFAVRDAGHHSSLEAAQPWPGAGGSCSSYQGLCDPVLHLSSVSGSVVMLHLHNGNEHHACPAALWGLGAISFVLQAGQSRDRIPFLLMTLMVTW